MIDVDKETRGFRPTIEWMRRRYEEMNIKLFNGLLKGCYFDIFTNGKGSEGRRLGCFKMDAFGLRYERSRRSMFKESYGGGREYISYSNFYDLCNPTILLNGNYSGTEYGFLSTLVHEMCHYYTYMKGYVPGKSHGPEFYSIGNIVSDRSGGLFTIKRLASAEDVAHLDLDAKMKVRTEKRIANKKSSIYAIFDFHSVGDIRLTTTSNSELINKICDFKLYNKNSRQVIITKDSKVIDFLFEFGYNRNFRTWRYWPITDKKILNILDSADKEVIKNFDKMDESISQRSIDIIIQETLNRFISERIGDEEVFDISSDMDLGAYSPLEIN